MAYGDIQVWGQMNRGHFWLGYIRMLGHLQMSAHLVNFTDFEIAFWMVLDVAQMFQFCNGSMLIPDILQMVFGYRHYANRKCPTSLPHHQWNNLWFKLFDRALYIRALNTWYYEVL